jgi:acyl-[acyl-carrier-protein]-phospholipid O-acyltransferase/long-chain-fatty-acid--[acyl-carrier-protein] ligase
MSADPDPGNSPGSRMDRPQPARKWRLGFWSLIVTQFQGAFNDNGLKFLVIYMILARVTEKGLRDDLQFRVGLLFAAPFILFSMTAGYLADRFSKRTVTICTKFFEVGVMLFAIAALVQPNFKLALAAVFLISTQSAFFGPSKYGLLPEILPDAKLSWGNGILELGTFLAAIASTSIAGFLVDAFHDHQEFSGLIFLGCTVVGLTASFGITRVLAAAPERKFHLSAVVNVWSPIRLMLKDRALWLSFLGNTYFFFLATILQYNIIVYGKDVFHATSTRGSFLQAAVALGIGVGSLAAGFLSGGKIEYGLIPLGSVGMTFLGLALAIPGISFVTVIVLLAALGFMSGFFIVPISALLQHRPPDDEKGAVLATANWFSWVGIGAAAGAYYMMTHYLNLSPGAIFLCAAVGTLAATAYVLWLLPDSLLRLLLWLATHTLYRLDVKGREHVPARGGALLAPNHVSMADAVFLIAALDRPIRFLMFKDIYEHPLIKPFAKVLGVIPISSNQGPREMIHSLREATQALQNGELVCIFPEGQLTRIGQLLPFRRGMERIMKGVEAPVVPVNLDGVWGSIFSFAGGRFLWKFPRHIPYPIRVTFGAPLSPTASATDVRRAVQDLGADAFARRKGLIQTLPQSFIHSARRNPRRLAMADGQRPKISFFAALSGSVLLARRLRKLWQGQDMVGVLLPPSVPAALVNFAAMLLGKVPVNLNYTASNEVLASCASQCHLETVVTARVFLEKVKIQPPAEALYIEDVAKDLGNGEKLGVALAAALLPWRLLMRFAGCQRRPQLDDIATIIFSSGSTGDPKGVILTHYNVASNVEQLNQVFMIHSDDRILGILPLFHSFGFTGTLCLPMATGIGVVFHPNPLDSRVIGALVRTFKITMLLATPTFLNAYTRRCEPEDFGSLRFVLAGAEKLPERISQAFEDRFGIRPLEGYGCTECAPVVSVNRSDFRAAAFRQVGAKRGSIGHPLPGITVKIVDPDSQQPLGIDQPGLLLVRGPNVMRGYLNKPEKTAEVLRDGWYNTGDIAASDEDGFLRITDRLTRFSKIGGEMVPHIKVEDLLQELAGATEQTFVVTSVPDEKKGERLMVLHTLDEPQLDEVLEKLGKADLPALWRPKAEQFLKVEALPYLGTGKLDLRKARELALHTTTPSQ